MNINKVMLAGNLTRDPEIKFLANDRGVCNFGLAINHKYKTKDGEQKEDTTFIDCEAWGRTAELIAQWLKKGSGCFLEGRLRLETWDDKETGQKRSKLKVVADQVQFVGGKRDGEGASAASAAPARPAPASQRDDSEPPF